MNKLFKKLFVSLLALTVAFAAVGCDSCNESSDPAPSGPTGPNTSIYQPEAPIITMAAQKELVVGDDFYLSPKTKNVKGDLVWSSSNEAVATVVNGTVSALTKGTTTITASYEGVTATTEVTVGYGEYRPNVATYSGIEVEDEATTAIPVGNDYFIGAYVDFNNKKFNDATFTYSSSNTEVLTIDANGIITPIKFGENVIITVNATWREEFTISKSFSVDVRENVLFFSNNEILQNLVVNTPAVFIPLAERDNVIDLKPSVIAGPQAVVDENVDVEVVPMDGTTAEEYSYDETAKVYSALALGKSMVKFSYTFEGSVYTSTFTIEAVRPVKEILTPVELYSAGAGTYKVLDAQTGLYANKTLVDYAWGEEAEVTLYDAYQDGEALSIEGEVAKNILVNFDSYTDTAVTLGTKTEQYTIHLNDATSYYISDANDVIGAFDKTDKVFSSIGYYVLLNDVDMTGAPAIKNNSQVKFQGAVEGQGYSIINPVVDLTREAHKGFFGMMQSGSAVRNLAFININSISNQPNVGWLTGEYSTTQKGITFENIYIDVNPEMEHRGGMFVRLYGKLNNFVINQNNGPDFDGKEWMKTANGYYGNSLLARITSTIVESESNNLNNVYVISGGRALQYNYTSGTSTHLSEPSYASDYSIAVNDSGSKIWNSTMTYGENETELNYVYDYFTNPTSIGGLGLKNPTVQSVIQEMGGNGKIAVAPNVRVYDTYSSMSVDTDAKHLANLEEFTYSPYWVIVNGAPVWKGIYDNVESHDEFFGINVGNQAVKNTVAVKNYTDYELTLNTFKSNLVTELSFSAQANEYFDIEAEEIKNEEQVVIGTAYKLVTKNVSGVATVPVVASFKYNGVQKTQTINVKVVNPFDVAINEVISQDGADIAIDGEYQFAISINGVAVENVTYASNNTSVALKAGSTDTFTAVAVGSATISATFTYNEKSETRDFVVNVFDPISTSSYVQIGSTKVVNEITLNAYNEFAVDVVLNSVAFDASKVAVTSSNTEIVTVEGNVIKLVKYVENATSTISVTLTEKGRTYNYSFVVKVANPFKLSVANLVADSYKLNLYSENALVVKVNDTVVDNVTFTTTATNATIADGKLTVNALGANATLTATFNYGQNTGVVITVPVTFYDAVVEDSVITVDGVELEGASISLDIPSTAVIGVKYNGSAVENVTLADYNSSVTVTGSTITTVSNGSFNLKVTYVVGGKDHVIVVPVTCIYPSVTIATPVEYDAASGRLITTATLEGEIFGASAGGQQLSIGNGLTVDNNGITLRAQTSETDTVAGIPYISNKKGANQVFELTIQTNVNTYVFTNVTYWTQIIYDVTDLKEALGTSVDYTIVNLGSADTLTDREQTLNGKGFFVGTTKDGSKYYESVYNVGFYKMAADVDMEKASLGYVNNPLTTGNRIGGFMGYFDGNGYTIDNLAAGKEGIFGRVCTYVSGNEVNSGKSYRYYEYNPVIKNLAITNVITSYYNAESFLATPILATVIGTDTYAATNTLTTVSNIYATVNKTDSTALGSFVYHLAGHAKMNNVYVVNDVEFNMVEANSFMYRMTNDPARASAAIADGTKVWDISMNYTEMQTGALFSWAYSNKGNAPTHGNEIATDTLDNTTNTYVVTTMPINFSTKGSLFAYPYNSASWLDLKYSAENGIVFNRDNFYKLGKASVNSGVYVAIGYAANEEVGNIIVPYTLKQSLVADAKALYANGGAIGTYGGTMFVCTTCGEIAINNSPVTTPSKNSACKSTTGCVGKYVNLDAPEFKFVNPVNDKKGTGPMASPLAYEFTVHTAADMAEYFSEDCGAWKLKHVKRYDNVNAMKSANNDYSSFTGSAGNGLWKVEAGELIWVGAQA